MTKDEDDDIEATPSPSPSPSTPTKRKPSNNNNNGTKRTPAGGPRTPSGARKTSAQKNVTPIRKASANANKTPNSAPARARSGVKKAEPTLLGDFLLGRPSPARKSVMVKARRRSLDVVKAEMKFGNIQQMQQPGKVQERVKQWQKNNAKAGTPEEEKNLNEIVVEYETESEVEVKSSTSKKSRTPEPDPKGPSPRPGRRKDLEGESKEKKPRSKSAAPKKRVISDEHWMKNRRKSPPGKGNTIPKNFLQATAINPPVERKIEDWVKRMADPEPPPRVTTPKRKAKRVASSESDEKPRSRKVSRHSPQDDGIRVRPPRLGSPDNRIRIKLSKDGPSDSGRSSSSKLNSGDDGIHINPSLDDDSIRVRPSDEVSVHSEIQIKRTRNDGSKRRPKENETPTPSPRKKSEHLAPPTESESRSRMTSYATTAHDDDATSYMSPTPSKCRNRKSDVTESLDEIPVGNSAFSVLDLPLGAEAGTMKRPEPKRNNSFAKVPKVLKRVYTEGMKRVHDSEPARGGPNQPPSIETWLNGTTDPFVERPATADPSLPVPKSPVSRTHSFKEDDREERELTAEHDHKQERKTRMSFEKGEGSPGSPRHENTRETLPSIGRSPPTTPLGLKRTLATRITSSPKSGKKFGLKDAIFDAFKGESAMAKTKTPTPFDLIGLREEDLNRTSGDSTVLDDYSEYERPKTSPLAAEKLSFEDVDSKQDRPAPLYARRPPPVAGGPSLSTIASVTSYSNSSPGTSETGTGSELSQTTVTQATVLSDTTGSSLSHSSKKSSSRNGGDGQTSLKRRLTKHKDLVSMLSLPDTTQPGRSQSIRSARSIRTTRTHLENATIDDLLRELAEDESKYMRELNTLVDGVIPVLLTCVLSKSDSAVAAGLFDPLAFSATDTTTTFTKPIVDMGIALERLKSLHKRISLSDPDSFLHWAQQARQIYEDYLRAWRTGFEDVVVNLAPASRKASLSVDQDPDAMPVDKNGDVITDSGERVDVAHLLKAPLYRVKNLARATKGFTMKIGSKKAQDVHEAFQKVDDFRRKRQKEEFARKEDTKAFMTDTTRARDPKTLEPAEGVTIDRSRQVFMKDILKLDMSHSTGQRMESEVEVTFRENSSNKHDAGDVLISEIVNGKACLLFPPISGNRISARKGDKDNQLVVMIRSGEERGGWCELVVLEADDKEVRDEWLDILPATPYPRPVVQKTMALDPEVASVVSAPGANLKSVAGTLKKKVKDEVPIGERRRRQYEEIDGERSSVLPPIDSYGPMTTAYKHLGAESVISLADDHVHEIKDLNEVMAKAGHRKLRPIRVDPNPRQPSKSAFIIVDLKMQISMSGALPSIPAEELQETKSCKEHIHGDAKGDIGGSIQFAKIRNPKIQPTSTPLKESMRPDPEVMTTDRPATPSRDDAAPPPPAHKSPVTPPQLKNIPVVDSTTPKAKNRRTSSPLKHEYQPSEAGTNEEYSDSDGDSYSDSEDSLDELDEAEVDDMPASLPAQSAIYGRKISPSGSLYSLPNTTLAPSNSASQAPYREAPVRTSTAETFTFHALVSCWNNNKGRWDPINIDPCLVTIGPGWIETYEADSPYASRSCDDPDASTHSLITPDADIKNPLVAQDLTPHVHIRQSNAVDVQIRSPLNPRSRFKKGDHIQYRTLNDLDCRKLYSTIHWSRLNNPVYIKLSEERRINNFGNHAYENAVENRRRNWIFRKTSFRRQKENDQPISESASTPSRESSRTSALKRFSGGGLFNIGKSSVSRIPGGTSGSSSSGFSNISPPDTPMYGSQAAHSSAYGSGGAFGHLGTNNIPIMLYSRSRSQWVDHGSALLTVSDPQPHQRQASALNHGPKVHILVQLKPSKSDGQGVVIIDEVLGADSFSKGGNTGIYVNIWRDIVDENGNVGMMPRHGGVSGKTEKWCLQSGRAADCEWIYLLCRSGGVQATLAEGGNL